MPIDYRIEPNLPAAELADVFRRSTILRPFDDLPRMQQMIDKADLIITARDGEKLVGVSRSLTDFCFACYLSDLAVDVAYQKQGIGKELVRLTREAIGPNTTLILIAAPAAVDYYGKIGFDKMDRAWWIDRKG
jgi:ribosomal protein S18 acetylase RimI-like enzyme